MDKKILEALNEQMREEINSAYLYLAMSSDMKFKNRTKTSSSPCRPARPRKPGSGAVWENLIARKCTGVNLPDLPRS